MGVYFHYANFSKRERFAIDAIGGGINRGAVGRTLAARAFHLLLMGEPAPGQHVTPGRPGYWAGDSIAIVGDDHLPDWEQFKVDFTDIDPDVILLVFDFDGFDEIGEAAENYTSHFMQLCYLVATRQALALDQHLRRRFGARYMKRYQDLCRERPYTKSADLAFPPGR